MLRRVIACASFALILPACGPAKPTGPPPPPFRGAKLVVEVIGDAPLARGIEAESGEWVASSGAEISIRVAPTLDPKGPPTADLVVFPGDLLGGLADRSSLLALPDALLRPEPAPATAGEAAPAEAPPDPFVLKEIVPSDRDQVTKYGEDRLALPLGGTALVLAYHRSAFDREPNKEAARAAGVVLAPPKTWEELDALARFFSGRDWDGDGSPDAGIALAWASDPEGVGDSTFLARAASLGQHRDQYSFLFDSDKMAPRVASPPFVEALAGIVGLLKAGPPEAAKLDAEGARAAFRSGKAAMLIDRAERVATWSGKAPIGVAPLPGSLRVYNPDRKAWETSASPNRPTYLPRGGGWLVGVVAASPRREAAIDLAKYLAGPDVTNRLRADPAFPMLATRGPQLGQGLADPRSAPAIDARAWADAVDRTINAVRSVVGLRVPGADGYLADLTAGRLLAVSGRDPEAALKGVAVAWEARTKSLGPARQLWHYRRSLNRLFTLPEPPPRGE